MNSDAGSPQGEHTVASGIFGTVTNKRVIYNRSRGWFSGGSREDIAMVHVTSVRIDTKRHVLAGVLALLIGCSFCFAPNAGVDRAGWGLLLLGVAALFLWGSPTVHVNTAGQDKNHASSWPWHKGQALAFVEAIRQQLIKDR